ncbi:hypothetical protein D4764_0159690, partial [Takifugu flavidus]
MEHGLKGTHEAGSGTLLNKIYTELYITEGQKNIRVVLTNGVAGVGKTFSVQKFSLDWAEEDQSRRSTVGKLLFIFDGLDESRFSLDFNKHQVISDVTQVSSVDVLLKEEYFRRRFGDEDLSKRIISHIKASRSLHIM